MDFIEIEDMTKRKHLVPIEDILRVDEAAAAEGFDIEMTSGEVVSICAESYCRVVFALTGSASVLERDRRESSVASLALSARAYNCLIRNGIYTVEELCEKEEVDLLAFRNMGIGSVKEIKNELGRRGLFLADDPRAKASSAQRGA